MTPSQVACVAPVGTGQAVHDVPQAFTSVRKGQRFPQTCWPVGHPPAQGALASMHAPWQSCWAFEHMPPHDFPSHVAMPSVGAWHGVHEAPQVWTSLSETQPPGQVCLPGGHSGGATSGLASAGASYALSGEASGGVTVEASFPPAPPLPPSSSKPLRAEVHAPPTMPINNARRTPRISTRTSITSSRSEVIVGRELALLRISRCDASSGSHVRRWARRGAGGGNDPGAPGPGPLAPVAAHWMLWSVRRCGGGTSTSSPLGSMSGARRPRASHHVRGHPRVAPPSAGSKGVASTV